MQDCRRLFPFTYFITAIIAVYMRELMLSENVKQGIPKPIGITSTVLPMFRQ
jgi:hypothetical protein